MEAGTAERCDHTPFSVRALLAPPLTLPLEGALGGGPASWLGEDRYGLMLSDLIDGRRRWPWCMFASEGSEGVAEEE
jgi:hypothetical protein